MEQKRVAERRKVLDRRKSGNPDYSGPERRKLQFRRCGFDMREGWPPICVNCGKVCGISKAWIDGASTTEAKTDSFVSICADCSKKRYPKFYSDN